MIDGRDLAELERRVEGALASFDASGLDVLGYGEITLVLGWVSGGRSLACKRLPPFPGPDAFDRYRTLFDEYLERLRGGGVDVVETAVHSVARPDGSIAAYCVQPALDARHLAPAVLRAGTPGPHAVLDGIVEAVVKVAEPTTGIDAQLANWAWDGTTLRYFDVTTPMLRDERGALRLDLDVFLAAFPWALRRPIGRFVIPDVVERFTRPRYVLLDFAGNLLKERLDSWLPAALGAINERVDPPISEPEVRRFYRGDARLWSVMLALRRADRWWQRHVRRRAYPFLLPGRIER